MASHQPQPRSPEGQARGIFWHSVEPDLRRALIQAGRHEATVNNMLAVLRAAVEAIERARFRVNDDLLWALLAMQAERYRRQVRR